MEVPCRYCGNLVSRKIVKIASCFDCKQKRARAVSIVHKHKSRGKRTVPNYLLTDDYKAWSQEQHKRITGND